LYLRTKKEGAGIIRIYKPISLFKTFLNIRDLKTLLHIKISVFLIKKRSLKIFIDRSSKSQPVRASQKKNSSLIRTERLVDRLRVPTEQVFVAHRAKTPISVMMRVSKPCTLHRTERSRSGNNSTSGQISPSSFTCETLN
jgi:hypothetical protein